MAKYDFSAAESFGVWHAFDGLCFWCGTPLIFRDVTVDHVVPESVGDDEGKFTSIKAMYGLADNFSVNTFLNWVPAHGKCNQRKGQDLFSPSPAMIAILESVAKRAPIAEVAAANATADKNKGRILGRLRSALEAEKITRKEVEELLAGIKQEPMLPAAEVALQVSPQWTIVRESNGLAMVTDGRRAGIIPVVRNPHHSWECSNCGQYGPWNGVICMSCGHMSDPCD